MPGGAAKAISAPRDEGSARGALVVDGRSRRGSGYGAAAGDRIAEQLLPDAGHVPDRLVLRPRLGALGLPGALAPRTDQRVDRLEPLVVLDEPAALVPPELGIGPDRRSEPRHARCRVLARLDVGA